MASVELKGLSKHYGAAVAVDDVSLRVEHGQLVCLLGPSGCGKTTTLRLIAGFIEPSAGEIEVGGKVLSSPSRTVPPEGRKMSMIFQSYALWPHMTVAENVAYGLKIRKLDRATIEAKLKAILSTARLEALADRYPGELSGGQQQRVSLARALVVEPETLLLDEPLSNLDAGLREATREALRGLLRELGVTTVFVTHDQSEALAFSDRIVLMRAGRVVECGPPASLYRSPSTRFAAEFLGGTNLLDATAAGDGSHVTIGAGVAIRLAVGSWSGGLRDSAHGTPLCVIGRPGNLRFADAPGPNCVAGDVVEDVFLGDVHRVSIRVEGLEDLLRIDVRDRPPSGACIVELPAESLHAVAPEHGG